MVWERFRGLISIYMTCQTPSVPYLHLKDPTPLIMNTEYDIPGIWNLLQIITTFAKSDNVREAVESMK